MPNIKSQKDRVAQSKKEAAHNKAIKSNLKTVVKKADAAIDSNAENKDAAIKVAVSALDAAKNKGVIHKNNAARRKSRLTKKLVRFQATVAAAETSAKSTKSTRGAGKRTAAKA